MMKTPSVGLLGLETLAALNSLGGEAPGGVIWEHLEEKRGKRVHSGSIYTTLKRMRDKGLIHEGENNSGRKRGIYGITPVGQEVLAAYQEIFSTRNDTRGTAMT